MLWVAETWSRRSISSSSENIQIDRQKDRYIYTKIENIDIVGIEIIVTGQITP